MKFKFSFPNQVHVAAMFQPWEAAMGPAEIATAIRLAEAAGFDKITCGEHFLMPNANVLLTGAHHPDATTALSFAAGVAPRLRLMSSISIVPLQNPIITAKRWATLDWLSGGRAEMAAAVGWIKEEYDLLGVPFERRGRLCDEYIAAMITLWSSDDPVFEGPTIQFRDVAAVPRPMQRPHIPIWFGGDADGVLNRIARWGKGWLPQFTQPDGFAAKLDYIRSRPDYHGRPIEISYSLQQLRFGAAHAAIDDPLAVGHADTQKMLDQIGWLRNLGVTEMGMPKPPLADFEAYCDWIRWLGEDVLPRAR